MAIAQSARPAQFPLAALGGPSAASGVLGQQFSRKGGSRMAKFIQVCASQNDLFALDDQGGVYQYNFKVKTWVKLIADRHSEEEMSGVGVWSTDGGGAAMLSGEPTRYSHLLGPS